MTARTSSTMRTTLASSALDVLEGVSVQWMLVALLFATGALVAASELQRRVLAAGGFAMPARSMLAITLAGNAVSATLPVAGSTAGTAFTHRQIGRRGPGGALTGWTLAMSGVISTSTLAALLGAGLAIGDSPTRALAGAGSALIGIAPIVMILLARRSAAVSDRLERSALAAHHLYRRMRRHSAVREWDETAGVSVSAAFARFKEFRLGGRTAVGAVGFSVCNWVADAMCLAVCVAAVHADVPWTSLAAIFATAMAASTLSFSPAGIGIVEASVSFALIEAGVPAGKAVTAAILYRAAGCWLPVVVGWMLHPRVLGGGASESVVVHRRARRVDGRHVTRMVADGSLTKVVAPG